jgi:hypothetical protein
MLPSSAFPKHIINLPQDPLDPLHSSGNHRFRRTVHLQSSGDVPLEFPQAAYDCHSNEAHTCWEHQLQPTDWIDVDRKRMAARNRLTVARECLFARFFT